jgi:hypothetical protein
MVDRVAAALCGEELWAAMPNGTVTSRFGGRDFFREKARIAIAAMREPTAEMYEGEIEPREIIKTAWLDDYSPTMVWQCMIDEALK